MQKVDNQLISLVISLGALTTFTPLFLKIGSVHFRLSYLFLFFAACAIPVTARIIKLHRVYGLLLLYYLYVLIRQIFTFDISTALFVDLLSKAILFSVFFTVYAGKTDPKIVIRATSFILLCVVGYHIYSGQLTYYKLIGEAKPLFGLLPLLIYHFGRRGLGVEMVASLAMLLMSGERKAVFGCLLALSRPFFARVLGTRNFRSIRGLVLVCLAILTIYFLPSALEFLGSRPTSESIAASAVSDRERIWQLSVAYQAVMENTLFGGGYNFAAELYSAEYEGLGRSTSLHSTPVVVLLDSGLVGLAFFGFFLWSYYKALIKGDEARSSIFTYALVLNCFMPVGFLTELLLFLPLLFPRRASESG